MMLKTLGKLLIVMFERRELETKKGKLIEAIEVVPSVFVTERFKGAEFYPEKEGPGSSNEPFLGISHYVTL